MIIPLRSSRQCQDLAEREEVTFRDNSSGPDSGSDTTSRLHGQRGRSSQGESSKFRETLMRRGPQLSPSTRVFTRSGEVPFDGLIPTGRYIVTGEAAPRDDRRRSQRGGPEGRHRPVSQDPSRRSRGHDRKASHRSDVGSRRSRSASLSPEYHDHDHHQNPHDHHQLHECHHGHNHDHYGGAMTEAFGGMNIGGSHGGPHHVNPYTRPHHGQASSRSAPFQAHFKPPPTAPNGAPLGGNWEKDELTRPGNGDRPMPDGSVLFEDD